MQETNDNPDTLVFRNNKNVGLHATLLIVGGGVFLLLGVVWFMMLLITPANSRTGMMPGLIGGLAVVPILLLGRAWIMLSQPARVVLDDAGITIEGRVSSKRLAWAKIADLKRSKQCQFMQNKKLETLDLLNEKGKSLAQLSEEIEAFETLAELIEARSTAARGAPTRDLGRETERKAKEERRNRWLLVVIGGLMTSLFAFVMWMAIDDYTTEQKLDQYAVHTEAAIDRHYLYNGTPRIEYTLTDPSGQTFTRNITMERGAWDELIDMPTVAVEYLADAPDRSRPTIGMVSEIQYPNTLLIPVGVIGTLACAFALVVGVVGVKSVSRENGKFRFKRFGEVEAADIGHGVIVAHPNDDQAPPTTAYDAPSTFEEPPATHAPIHATPRYGLLAIGILNIALGLIGTLWHSLRLLALAVFGGRIIEMEAGTIEVPIIDALFVVDTGTGAILSLLLGVSAIGILRHKHWGRICALIASVGKLLFILVSLIVMIVMFPTEMVGEGAEHGDAYLAGWLGGTIYHLIMGIYPLIVLVVLGRRGAREAFA